MSPVAENVIPVPEVTEHFGDVSAVLDSLAVRDAAARLLADCDKALCTPFFGDFGLVDRLQLHTSSLRAAVASSGSSGRFLAFKTAQRSLGRFNDALSRSRAAGV